MSEKDESLFGVDPLSYERWRGRTIVMCQTNGRDLWEGIQSLRSSWGAEKEPWPYPVNPDCKCERCKSDE